MSQPTYERLREWFVWYEEHKRDGVHGDLSKRVEFLQTTVEGAFDVIARLAEDVKRLEGLPPESLGRRLWLPTGIKGRGDVRRIG